MELAFYYPATRERTRTCAVEPRELTSETGFGVYPAKDAVLILRWRSPEKEPRPFTFRIEQSSKSQKEVMKGKTLCHVGIDP